MIKAEGTGALFDPTTQLATQQDLIDEGLTGVYPVSYSVYKTQSALYYSTTSEAAPVADYQNVEIDSSCVLTPAQVETDLLDYNFTYTPEARASFPFQTPGVYFVDFMMYPKEGAAIVWRTWVTVQ